ncbi:MAG: hypothetical protein R2877_03115, partial [Bdellovibrionota bacterium]
SSPNYQQDVVIWRKLRDQRNFENSRYNLNEFYQMKKFDTDMENARLRNQMMAIALSETPSRCGQFNFDRRKGS